ncbi:MAG: hypothetical protein J5I52_02350 [Saprospiraceae bacterium]|nr:MAG: hypothetical protein UZ09_BCD002001553 [Bacteroidetes bacterium OLB9]MCO6462969.1 hypothetical protein [Saprospiraceae bacterium]
MHFRKIKVVFVIMLIFSGLVMSCRNKVNRDVADKSTSVEATYETKEFLEFYDRFGSDSVFQMQHIVFPLEGMKAIVDSLERPDPDFHWQKEDWVIHGPFDDMDGTFSREFVDFNGLVIEKIYDPSGTFSMERRFKKLASGWNLIYYREMGRY